METEREVPESLPVVEKRTWLANSFQKRLNEKKGKNAVRSEGIRTGIDEKQKWLENANKKHSPAVGKRSSPAGKRSKSVTEKDISSSTLNNIRSDRSVSESSGLDFIKVENQWLEEELYKKKHVDRALEILHNKQTQEAVAKELEKIMNSNDFDLGITPPPLEDEDLIGQTITDVDATETRLETSIYYAGDVTEDGITPVKASKPIEQCNNVQSTNTDVGGPSPAIIYFAGDVNEANELTPLPSEKMRQNNVVSLNEHDESYPHDTDHVSKNLESELLSADNSTKTLATNDIQNTLETSVEVESPIGVAETAVFKVLDMKVDNDSNHVESTFDGSSVILQTTNIAIECTTENDSNVVTSGTDCESTQQTLEDQVLNENSFSVRTESEDKVDVGAEALSSNLVVDETNEAHSTGENQYLGSLCHSPTSKGDIEVETAIRNDTFEVPGDIDGLCHSPTSMGDVEVETTVCHDTSEVPTNIDDIGRSPTYNGDVEIETTLSQNNFELPSDETKDGIYTAFESAPMAAMDHESNKDVPKEDHLEENVEVEALMKTSAGADTINEADHKSDQRLESMEIVIHNEIEEAKEESSRINTDLAIELEEPSGEICDKAEDDIDIDESHESKNVTPVIIENNVSENIEVEQPMLLSIDKETCDDQSSDLVDSAISQALGEKQDMDTNSNVNNSENSDSHVLDHIVVLSQSSVVDDLTFVTDLRVDNEHVPDNTTDACPAEAIENELHEAHSTSVVVVNDPTITNDMIAVPAPLDTNCGEGVVQAGCDDLVQTSADQILPKLEKKSNAENLHSKENAKDKVHSNDDSNTKSLSGFLFRVKIQEASISEGSQSPSKFHLARKSSEHAEPKIMADDNTKSVVINESTTQVTNAETHAEEDCSAPPALAASSTSLDAAASPDIAQSTPAVNAPLSAESIEQTVSKSEIITVPGTTDILTSDVENDNTPQQWSLKLQSTRSIIDGFKAELAAPSSSFENENIPDEEPLKKSSSVKIEEPDVSVGVHCLESCSIM